MISKFFTFSANLILHISPLGLVETMHYLVTSVIKYVGGVENVCFRKYSTAVCILVTTNYLMIPMYWWPC